MTAPATPSAVHAEVVAVETFDATRRIVVAAPRIASAYRPGQFITVAVGDDLGMPLPRSFSIMDADPATGLVEFAVSVFSRGTAWLARRLPGEVLSIVGPLGRPFTLPSPGACCLVIAGGHGGAGVYRLIRELTGQRNAIHLVIGATTKARLFAVDALARVIDAGASSMTVTTDDGSAGLHGSITMPLRDLADRHQPEIAYACGSMPMLQAVSLELDGRMPLYVATETAMACGFGVCLTCTLPIVGADGLTRMTRSCVDGPVFRADRVRWEAIGTVPANCVGGVV